jgi:hypothetical protein
VTIPLRPGPGGAVQAGHRHRGGHCRPEKVHTYEAPPTAGM